MRDAHYHSPPVHVKALNTRIRNIAEITGTNESRLRRVIANTIVAQVLPSGVVKGGTAMKFRIGEAGSRFTPDLDTARQSHQDVDDFIDALGEALITGWGGFTGRIVRVEPADPPGVPAEYVMQPFDVKVQYRDQSWLTVRLELGHDEIGSTSDATSVIAQDIVALVTRLGLPMPEPVPVLNVEHQIAQKLHACSTPDAFGNNARAHDLVDLQLLTDVDPPDLTRLWRVGERLFAARRVANWPPVIRAWNGWDALYEAAGEGLEVLALPEAVEWANDLIAAARQAADDPDPGPRPELLGD